MGHPAARAVVDFLNGNPIVRSGKNIRNQLLDGYFRSLEGEKGKEIARNLPQPAREALCVTIAFNTPWVIDILTAAWQRFTPGMVLIVADNSSSLQARDEIRSICRQRAVPYLGLPRNPEWSPNRSHGIALNWVYYNLIRHVAPEVFGFMDHDCFPVAPTDIPARMSGRAVYGLGSYPAQPDVPWSLWAGFCFFRFADVAERPLDFKHRIELRLDTGGGNWNVLYRFLRPEQVLSADHADVKLSFAGIDSHHQSFEGEFLHLGGASYVGSFSRDDYRRLLSDYIWDTHLGGRSQRLVDP